MGVYDRSKATALRLIAKYGDTVTWRQLPVPAPADKTKPWVGSPSVPVEYTVAVAFFPKTGQMYQLMRQMVNSEVPTGDEIGYMGSVSFEPSVKDTLVRSNGDVYRVSTISPVAPNGEGVILYEIEFMK